MKKKWLTKTEESAEVLGDSDFYKDLCFAGRVSRSLDPIGCHFSGSGHRKDISFRFLYP